MIFTFSPGHHFNLINTNLLVTLGLRLSAHDGHMRKPQLRYTYATRQSMAHRNYYCLLIN